jgi:hypothetical protein
MHLLSWKLYYSWKMLIYMRMALDGATWIRNKWDKFGIDQNKG